MAVKAKDPTAVWRGGDDRACSSTVSHLTVKEQNVEYKCSFQDPIPEHKVL